MFAIGLHAFFNLGGEFTGGCENQGADRNFPVADRLTTF